MAYQVAKDVGAMSAVLNGKVDAILLTGGVAYDKRFCSWIKEKVGFLADVRVYPGEDEMSALSMNGLMVMKGELEPKVYS